MLALESYVPGNPAVQADPGQLVTRGRKNPLSCFPLCSAHTLVCCPFVNGFSKLYHFVSAICFFAGPRLTHQELQEDGLVFRALAFESSQ